MLKSFAQLSSFQRQLNLYGFTRIASSPDTGGYYHELFLKGRRALVMHMRRDGVPKPPTSRRTRAVKPAATPDFYSI
jgi:HSF-type DNA-binding